MKISKIFIAVITLVAFTMVACSEYEDTVVPSPEVPAGNQGVFFPTSNVSVFELEPTEPTEITLTIGRTEASGAVEVPIIIENNDDNVFNVPGTISFPAGEKEVDFKVSFPEASEGTTYNLKVAVEGDEYVNPYSSAKSFLTASVTRIKWVPVEEPMIYLDGAFSGGYGVSSFPMYVSAERAELGGAVRYRFLNAYDVPTQEEPDADGIYDGYPYNDPGDFDEGNNYYTVIEINDPKGVSGSVYMQPNETGVIWSYGMISIGSVNSTTLGSLSNGLITFPGKSLFFSEAGYNSGQRFEAGSPTYIYLTKEAFIAANMKIEDYNDVEYEAVTGEIGEFNSAAYGSVLNKTLSKAIDIDIENEESEYKNLYYLADLYAEDFGLAFYTTESGSITIPENQPIGTEVFGQKLYVSQSEVHETSVEVNSKGVTVYTFGLIFHYEDGTIVGDFSEKFYYSESEVVFEKSEFLGNFNLTGLSQFSGEDDADMDVVIEESEVENTFIITGIDYAEEVVATFDGAAGILSIAPQELADLVSGENTYDLTLYTTDATGVSSTSAISLEFDLDGNLVLATTSEADGYIIQSVAAGGSIDGYYNLQFSPVEEVLESLSTKSASVQKISTKSNMVIKEKSDNGTSNNFKIQGKKSQGKPNRVSR